MVRIQTARLDEFFYFCNRYVGRRGHDRIEISCCGSVDQIAERISPPGLHQSKLRTQRQFQDVVPSIPGSRFLVFCRDRPIAGWRVEAADPGAPGPNAFCKSSLRAELDLQSSVSNEVFESPILANVARDHLLHLLMAQEESDAEVFCASIVADHGQVPHTLINERLNQILRNAAQPEATDHDGCAILDVGNRLFDIRNDLVHPGTRSSDNRSDAESFQETSSEDLELLRLHPRKVQAFLATFDLGAKEPS